MSRREEIHAMEAGPKMDALVAESVMGWSRRDTDAGPQWVDAEGTLTHRAVTFSHDHIMWIGWRPSVDIAAAWDVVEALRTRRRNLILNDGTHHPPTYEVQAGIDEHGPWTFCAFELDGGINSRSARAMTAPLAICRAALLTTLSEEEYAEGRRWPDGTRVADGKLVRPA